jgi:hypothetical protein
MKNILTIIFFLFCKPLFCQEETILRNLEGFYSSGWEYSNFREMDFQNCLLVEEHWTKFNPNLEYKGESINYNKNFGSDSVYMKVNAIQKKGKSLGHLGSWTSEITITEILEIDSTRNFNRYIKEDGPVRTYSGITKNIFKKLNTLKCEGTSKMISYLESKDYFTKAEIEETLVKPNAAYRLSSNSENNKLKIYILDHGFSLMTNSSWVTEVILRDLKYFENNSAISYPDQYLFNGEKYYIGAYKTNERMSYFISTSCTK